MKQDSISGIVEQGGTMQGVVVYFQDGVGTNPLPGATQGILAFPYNTLLTLDNPRRAIAVECLLLISCRIAEHR